MVNLITVFVIAKGEPVRDDPLPRIFDALERHAELKPSSLIHPIANFDADRMELEPFEKLLSNRSTLRLGSYQGCNTSVDTGLGHSLGSRPLQVSTSRSKLPIPETKLLFVMTNTAARLNSATDYQCAQNTLPIPRLRSHESPQYYF